MNGLNEMHEEILLNASKRNNLLMECYPDSTKKTFHTKDGLSFDTNGGDFEINELNPHALTRDKSASAYILNKGGVESIQHIKLTKHLLNLLNKQGLPGKLVMKETMGIQGDSFKIIDSLEELNSVSEEDLKSGKYCLSLFYDYEDEIRVSVVKGKVLFMYAKVRSSETLQHNLSKGATVAPVTNELLRKRVEEVALRSVEILGLDMANVDMFLYNGNIIIMEVNASITLKRVAYLNPEWIPKITEVYTAILELAIEKATNNLSDQFLTPSYYNHNKEDKIEFAQV